MFYCSAMISYLDLILICGVLFYKLTWGVVTEVITGFLGCYLAGDNDRFGTFLDGIFVWIISVFYWANGLECYSYAFS